MKWAHAHFKTQIYNGWEKIFRSKVQDCQLLACSVTKMKNDTMRRKAGVKIQDLFSVARKGGQI